MIQKLALLGLSLMLCSQWGYSQLKINSDGFVGIGTNDPQTRLQVYGDAQFISHAAPWESALLTRVHNKNASAYTLLNGQSGEAVFFVNGEGWLWSKQAAFTEADSSRLQNRKGIPSALESVLQLNGIRFMGPDKADSGSANEFQLGLVAQEVVEVVPEATMVMPDSLMAVSYSQLVPLLVEAIKEQQDQITELQAALFTQEEEIGKIKSRRWFRKKTVE